MLRVPDKGGSRRGDRRYRGLSFQLVAKQLSSLLVFFADRRILEYWNGGIMDKHKRRQKFLIHDPSFHSSRIPLFQHRWLFLKIIHKGPLILRPQHLEGHLAIGTHDEITWLLVTIQRDLSFTDWTCQLVCHGFFPYLKF